MLQSLVLDGTWRFMVDLRDAGVRERWYAPAFPDRDWRPVPVPQAWDTYAYEFRGYEWIAWLRRTFTLDRPQPRLAWLRFDGAGHHVTAWLNGRPLGEHEGAYGPFAFQAAAALRKERNVLAVRINNLFTNDTLPPLNTDFWKYGGITRSVNLALSDTPVLERVTALVGGSPAAPRITVQGRIEAAPGMPRARTVTTVIRARPGGAILTPALTQPVHGPKFQLHLPGTGLPRWSPEHPRLLHMEVTVADARGRVLDRAVRRFGVRTLQWDHGQLRLNDRPLWLRGVNQVEEYPCWTPTPSRSQLRARLRDIRDHLHANFFRAAHYPHHPLLPELCDELGLLLLEEIPLCYAPELKDTTARGRRMAEELFWRDAHHPSVILWSAGNERPAHQAATARGVVRVIRHFQRLDRTRPITSVSNRPFTDQSLASHDVLVINEYFGIWHGTPLTHTRGLPVTARELTAWLADLHRRFPDKPLVIGEFGAPCFPIANTHMGSEPFQAAFIRTHMNVFRTTPYLSGCAAWCYCDQRQNSYQGYPAPLRGTTRLEVFGLKTLHGRRRPAWHVLAAAYRRLARKR